VPAWSLPKGAQGSPREPKKTQVHLGGRGGGEESPLFPEALGGRPPCGGQGALSLLRAHLRSAFQRFPALSSAFQRSPWLPFPSPPPIKDWR
jgi:hypothetical protein